MFAFMMTAEIAAEFFRRAKARNAETEEERAAILWELAREGHMLSVTETNRSEDEYVADLKRNFGVLDGRRKIGFDPEKTLDAVWCVDSETGERVLIDRETNQIIMREKL